MKIFWPHRSNAKGFAIKNIASRDTEKIPSLSSNQILNKFSDDRIFKSTNKDIKNIALSHLSIKKVHWANRDFSEYREAV